MISISALALLSDEDALVLNQANETRLYETVQMLGVKVVLIFTVHFEQLIYFINLEL